MNVVRSFGELLREAREAEANEETEMAIKLYQIGVKQEPHNEVPYNHLMILYRKQKMYREKLELLNKGIKAFEEFYEKRSRKFIRRNKKAEQLSNSLVKSLGQKGKKRRNYIYLNPFPNG